VSGPKAFRIVTPAEIISIYRRNLARLDARPSKSGLRPAGATGRSIRRTSTGSSLDATRSVACSMRIGSPNSRSRSPAETSYLQADAERRAEKAAEAEARRKGDFRRTKSAAQGVAGEVRIFRHRCSARPSTRTHDLGGIRRQPQRGHQQGRATASTNR
jgi:hypothetical protein